MPRVLPGEGLYPLVTCAVVEMRFASPKSAPAVMATWPRRLNLRNSWKLDDCEIGEEDTHQPVIHEKNGANRGGESIYAQKYGPPAIGTAERISAMPAATNIAFAGQCGGSVGVSIEKSLLKKPTTIQPTVMTPGPPVFKPYVKSLLVLSVRSYSFDKLGEHTS